MEKVEYNVLGMHCVSCSSGIKKIVSKQKGIEDVEVELSASKIVVTFKEEINDAIVVDNIARLGYKAVRAE
ncbi:MAG: heavy-metal-associated domain-containing protein [Candidatus Izemoplasmataceae bacterium]|jgi:P-type Cu+ transporter|uniref:heavy-metal-associated domain-containing protein n=1 Tax=Liberiplasma polymorphum TaxID=3374570 RepID=UPI003773598A